MRGEHIDPGRLEEALLYLKVIDGDNLYLCYSLILRDPASKSFAEKKQPVSGNIRFIPQGQELGGDSWILQGDIQNTTGKMLHTFTRKRIYNDVGTKAASFRSDVYSESESGS